MPDTNDQDIQAWDFPYVEANQQTDNGKTNALNRRSNWKYEPPEEVEEILPPTAEEIVAIRDAAYQEGFDQGKQEGLEKGLEEGQQTGYSDGEQLGKEAGIEQGLEASKQQIQQKVDALDALFEHLQKPVEQVDKQLQIELVKLSTLLARSVIKIEVQTNESIIIQALSEGLKVLPIHEQDYQISVNPDDLTVLKEHFSEQQLDRNNWQFIEAPGLSRGGCDITTTTNAVDVTIERRIKDVIDKFLLEQGLDSQ